VRLWKDTTRVEQLARLGALELQSGDDYGSKAWQMAEQAHRDLPNGVRIDLPSPRVFGRVLGLFRTGATLKSGKLIRLELSIQEIADLVGYSKATVASCLRWLGSEAIDYEGQPVARGLGFIHRGRRTAWAFLDRVRKRVYRTSRLILTLYGRLALGLGDRSLERKKEKRQQRHQQKQTHKESPPAVEVERREEQHVQSKAGGDGGPDDDAAAEDVGKSWIQRIHRTLR